ncbi:MAG: Ig domain-containing protein [Acidobacteriota bacterium]
MHGQPGLLSGKVGTLYLKYMTASPAGMYTYSLTGLLPPGVTFHSSIGLLFGYPTTAGPYNFTITAKDLNNCMGMQNYSVAIAP